MERNSDNTDSIKTQVIPKKYVKIAQNQIQNLPIKNKEVYKILLESQVKEKPIAYIKWEKCLKKDRMHTLTCITQTLLFTFNYLEQASTIKFVRLSGTSGNIRWTSEICWSLVRRDK